RRAELAGGRLEGQLVARSRGGQVLDSPAAPELFADRRVDGVEGAGAGGAVERAAGRVGELLQPGGVGVCAEGDRVDDGAGLVERLERAGLRGLAADVVAVGEQDDDLAAGLAGE